MPDLEQKSLGGTHLNNGLFSDYYLNDVVPTLPEWNDENMVHNATMAYNELRELRAMVQPESLSEAQLEVKWIQPVLNILGLHYSVQVQVRYGKSGLRKPDYVFVRSREDAYSLSDEVHSPDQLAHALAIGDAKRWGINLDQSASNDRNPAKQIDEYLYYSELPWGILTDGRYWRIYHRDTSRNNSYYAVDLDQLLEAGSLDNFLYFYAFFRREAFTYGWLTQVLASSEDFAQKLTDKLEDEVFEALEMIAQGFLDYRRNRLHPDAATLRSIYENSLVLLYRLLFIFYAESRAILPMFDNDEYTNRRSLTAIKRRVANDLKFNVALNPDSSSFYNSLQDLFFAIDAGDPSLDLPPYNGKLFSDRDHPFLGDNGVGDSYLVPALDKLARVDIVENRRQKRVFVDYRDLDVRHLGSIYEKLLEYELAVADQPLKLKGQQYVPAKEAEDAIKQPGQVYLRTGSNERKVTGSYYTPDYIVRFIVEKTLEPLLSDITARHATLDETSQWHVHDADSLVGDVLALNVLDPATGSGHFVVDVTSYIAEWLTALSLRPQDMGDEDELTYWKRVVASACIYAVDINPLAVELAKLSMWLTTLAKGKPLSFLDHHIRVGNSLVGAKLSVFDEDDVAIGGEKRKADRIRKREKKRREAETEGQLRLFDYDAFTAGVRFAVTQMTVIEGMVADSVSDVKKQEQLYADLTRRLGTYKQSADVWTARYFGLELTPEQWQAVRKLTTTDMIPPALQSLMDKTEQLAAEQHFFHWELAFPEIFFDADGQPKETPGFDAVVGNPPYVRQERIQPIKPFLQSHYEVYSGTADLFLYFYELGLQFVKEAHRLGYITSGTYMNSNSAKSFRQYIHDNAGMEWVANFGENQPFRGAEMVYPTIAIMRNSFRQETFNNKFLADVVSYEKLHIYFEDMLWEDCFSSTVTTDEWRFQDKKLTDMYLSIVNNRRTLSELTNGRIYYGIKTGLNDVFVIDKSLRNKLLEEDSASGEIIKPMLRGQDFRPWYQIDSNLFLIFAHGQIDIEQYPVIKSYLEQYRTQLEPKPDDWKGKWPGRKAGSYKWYQTQDQVSYHAEFDKPKIYWAEIAKLPRFSWDDGRYCSNNKAHMIVFDSPWLLSVLNSRVSWFVLSQIAVPLRLRGGLWQYQLTKQFVERVPIPDLIPQQESDLAAIAEEITRLARSRYQVHENFRQTLRNEFNGDEISTRVALYRWWELPDEKALSNEVNRRFGVEIPLSKRSNWRGYLAEERGKHQQLTWKIIELETVMNEIVYDAFDLTPEERQLIEETTKYPYGEV